MLEMQSLVPYRHDSVKEFRPRHISDVRIVGLPLASWNQLIKCQD